MIKWFYNKIFLIVLSIFIVSFCLAPVVELAQAAEATLFLSPGSGTYTINKSFTVKVMVNSGGVGINAAEGTINYDPSYLLVSKVSDIGSIFKLWTTEPTYSNTDGKVTFGGGAPGAYTGSAGTIFSITFMAKKIGEAKVSYSSGIVLAADGKGTNVFSGSSGGAYIIKEAKAKEVKKPEEKKEKAKGILPPVPEISSPTHPDKNIWYSNNEPEFVWKLLTDLTGVSYLIDTEPISDPGNVSDGIIESEKFSGQEDGELYFHIKYQNQFGWGQPAHRKFLVDATPPEAFTIVLDNGGDTTNPTPKLRFITEDKTSGIDYYYIRQGLKSKKVVAGDMDQDYYQTEPLVPDKYIIEIAAVDKAGNSASSSINFIIDPLKAPIITNIPKLINKKEELIIQGTSFYPQVTVKIYIGKNNEEPEQASVKTDDDGNWSYFYKSRLEKGNYEIWAKIIDNRGAQSLDSIKHLLTVVSPSLVDSYGWLIILILCIIIAGLVMYILYQRKEFKEEKERIMGETREVKDKLRKIFAALREEVNELVELTDKKPGLSESERKVKEKLQESLDISEEFINKEVEDVEKEIKIKKENEIK